MINALTQIRINLSRIDGQSDNTLVRIIGAVAKEQFQIQEASLYECGAVRFVRMAVAYKGRTAGRAAAYERARASLGQVVARGVVPHSETRCTMQNWA